MDNTKDGNLPIILIAREGTKIECYVDMDNDVELKDGRTIAGIAITQSMQRNTKLAMVITQAVVDYQATQLKNVKLNKTEN